MGLPLVVLLQQHAADEPDDRCFIGEDSNDVGAELDLLVEALDRVGGVDLCPLLGGESPVGKDIDLAVADEAGNLRPLGSKLVGGVAQRLAGAGALVASGAYQALHIGLHEQPHDGFGHAAEEIAFAGFGQQRRQG